MSTDTTHRSSNQTIIPEFDPNALSPRDTALWLLDESLWPVVIEPNGKAPIGEPWGLTRPPEGDLASLGLCRSATTTFPSGPGVALREGTRLSASIRLRFAVGEVDAVFCNPGDE
jgi:hypothetical protein